MKIYHCCVPGCSTYADASNFIQLPSNFKDRLEWISTIPKKDWTADHCTIICYKHFKTEDLIFQTCISKGKNSKQLNLSAPQLRNEASPSWIIEKNPVLTEDIEQLKLFIPRHMFELYPRDDKGPETFEDIENEPMCDFVIDYWFFSLKYPEKLHSILNGIWQITSTTDCTIFFATDFTDIPRIRASIKVLTTLKVEVTLGGRVMDPNDLTWALPIGAKLNRWSQLRIMLAVFGK